MPLEHPVAEAIETIRSVAGHMRGDSRFKVAFEEYPKLDEGDLSEWEQWIQKQPGMAQYRIPSSLRTVYSASGGFRFQWQYLAERPKATTGSAELVTVFSLYQRDDEADRPLSAIYANPRQFDMISETEYVGIVFSPDSSDKISLVHIDNEERTRKTLALDPIEYLRRLAEYRAVYGWQALFVAGEQADSEIRQKLKNEIATLFAASND